MSESIRHALLALAVLSPLALSACGSDDEKTVVVNPQPGATVVVNPDGTTKTCPPGATTC